MNYKDYESTPFKGSLYSCNGQDELHLNFSPKKEINIIVQDKPLSDSFDDKDGCLINPYYRAITLDKKTAIELAKELMRICETL